MGYNRSYYAHGAEPFAYQWHGRIQYPARDQGSLHGLGSLGSHTLEKITLGAVAQPSPPILAPAPPAQAAPKPAMSTKAKIAIGVGALGLLYCLRKKK
jgi:hypothetical protein